MSKGAPMCLFCKRYQEDKKRKRNDGALLAYYYYCEAYPDGDGIPISVHEMGHFRSKPGDHGLQFEPRSDVSADTVEVLRRTFEATEDNPYEPPPDDMDT